MEITCIIFLVAIIRGIVSALQRRKPMITTIQGSVRESLCMSCAYAHIARGYRERDRIVSCTYAGSVRRIRFAISTCSMYCNRGVTSRIVRIAGFAQAAGVRDAVIAAKMTR